MPEAIPTLVCDNFPRHAVHVHALLTIFQFLVFWRPTRRGEDWGLVLRSSAGAWS